MRRSNIQNFSWFYDLYRRGLIDLDPPYQRRSVWNQRFKDYFIETILLGYPSPAIFLFSEISADGRSTYHVVDGKQRLTTLFEFVEDRYPVSDKSAVNRLQGEYFSGIDEETRRAIWSYQILVEYIDTDSEDTIDAIFDRLNRNVSKLTHQELRHAKFDGRFISKVDELTNWIEQTLPKNFPRIAATSKRQMKDNEFFATILLLLEEGTRSLSQTELDLAFATRDDEWEREDEIVNRFRTAIGFILEVVALDTDDQKLAASRLRNQADFYSLVGAINELHDAQALPSPALTRIRLVDFLSLLENEETRSRSESAVAYFDAARSASNDKGPRDTRIRVIKSVISAQNQ